MSTPIEELKCEISIVRQILKMHFQKELNEIYPLDFPEQVDTKFGDLQKVRIDQHQELIVSIRKRR